MGKYTDPHRPPTVPSKAPEIRPSKRKYTIVHNNDNEYTEKSVESKPIPGSRKYTTTLRPTTYTTQIDEKGDIGRKDGDLGRNVDKLVFGALLDITKIYGRAGDAITFERWRWGTQQEHVWLRRALEVGITSEEFYEGAQRLIDLGLVVGNPFGLSGSWAICGGVKPAGQREVDFYHEHCER